MSDHVNFYEEMLALVVASNLPVEVVYGSHLTHAPRGVLILDLLPQFRVQAMPSVAGGDVPRRYQVKYVMHDRYNSKSGTDVVEYEAHDAREQVEWHWANLVNWVHEAKEYQ